MSMVLSVLLGVGEALNLDLTGCPDDESEWSGFIVSQGRISSLGYSETLIPDGTDVRGNNLHS
jgi:hypothetical protein